jgi:hypothetical protein
VVELSLFVAVAVLVAENYEIGINQNNSETVVGWKPLPAAHIGDMQCLPVTAASLSQENRSCANLVGRASRTRSTGKGRVGGFWTISEAVSIQK